MTMELRILGWLQGLMLGLILAAPLLSPAYMPWGVQMLFALSAFQLRQADRRWALRPGMTGWISHIRMAPSRMLPWAASAVVALIADGQGAAAPGAILLAALTCELLLYPLLTRLIGGWQWRRAALAMIGLIAACAIVPAGAMQNIAMFGLGVTGCLFWLRGPDGDLRATLAAFGGGLSAIILAFAMPATMMLAFPLAVISVIVGCAQATTVRRPLLPWTGHYGAGTGWLQRLRSRPS